MKRKFLFIILTVLIFSSFDFGRSNKVLAGGDPNLTENVASRRQTGFEWTFQNDEMSPLLAEVSGNSPTVENSEPEGFSSRGNTPSNLVGRWVARRGSGAGYINPNTGETSGPNATVHSYTFYANGTFTYAILMQSSLYQCTTTINAFEAGTFQANDSAIGLVTKKATKSYRDTCRPNLNSSGAAEIPAPKKLYYRFARDQQNNLNLCLSDEAGRSSCFVKQ